MDDQQFYQTLRRALQIKARADAAFHTLRGLNADINGARQNLQAHEQALAQMRASTDHHGTRRQRDHIGREIAKQLSMIEECKIEMDVLRAAHSDARKDTDTLAPQRDNVMKHIQKLRHERLAAAVVPYVSDKSHPYAFELDESTRLPPMPTLAEMRAQINLEMKGQ